MSDVHHTDDEFIELDNARKIIRDKILHILSIYPRLSMSMIQVGIGTSLVPALWHPVFDALLKEGAIVKDEIHAKSAIGRDQVYTVIHLP
jgi:hypothetical protein